jgi:hypothetical protein
VQNCSPFAAVNPELASVLARSNAAAEHARKGFRFFTTSGWVVMQHLTSVISLTISLTQMRSVGGRWRTSVGRARRIYLLLRPASVTSLTEVGRNLGVKDVQTNAMAITNDIAWRFTPAAGFGQLAGNPFRDLRVTGDPMGPKDTNMGFISTPEEMQQIRQHPQGLLGWMDQRSA